MVSVPRLKWPLSHLLARAARSGAWNPWRLGHLSLCLCPMQAHGHVRVQVLGAPLLLGALPVAHL